jgi:hypothetical protein
VTLNLENGAEESKNAQWGRRERRKWISMRNRHFPWKILNPGKLR